VLNWRLLAERRILAAIERGEFDDLPGKGQPLQWRENPLVPSEWRLAFDLLERAGLAPEWIMRNADIRADIAALEQKRQQEQRWMENRRIAMTTMFPQERAAERARLGVVQARTCEQVRLFVKKLNRKIADYNLIVPIVRLQLHPLDWAEEKAALQAAWEPRAKEETP
jgi:hypothetical protein